MGDVTESFAVLQTKGFSVVADTPVFAVSGEDSFFGVAVVRMP
jgi:hypothetical protein